MSALAFFPWFTIPAPASVGSFRLIPHRVGASLEAQPRLIDAILAPCQEPGGTPVESATLVQVAGRPLIDEPGPAEEAALFRLGASVFYDEVLDVHVSGHASQEEQKMLINLVRPRYFVPIHGEYRHLVWHSRLAEQCGVPRADIFVIESGDVLEIDENGPRRAGRITEGVYYVDGSAVAEMEQAIQAERSSLANNGVLVATVVLDKYTNSIVGEPHIESRGFMYEAESDGIAERIKAEIVQVIARGGTRSELLARLDASLKRVALAETGRRPIIIPILLKV